MQPVNDVPKQKEALRRAAYAARRAQPEKLVTSRQAIANLTSLNRYQAAKCVLWYVDARSELRTQWFLPGALQSSKQIAVPYCTERNGEPHLGLWRIEALEELARGKWNILEPPRDRWDELNRSIAANELDVVIVPGVAFSKSGARLGNGQGYYDRLLSEVRSECVLIGLCYESQIIDDLVSAKHDIAMDYVVTESQAYYSGKPVANDE